MPFNVKPEAIGKVQLENGEFRCVLDHHTPQEALASFYQDPGTHQYIEQVQEDVKPSKLQKHERQENQ